MRFEEVVVTPKLAEEWLATTELNRTVTAQTVAGYAKEMASGNWKTCLEAIAFNVEGHLSNGQHRLLAVIQSGVPQKMVVAYDVPIDTVFDRGRKRSTGDSLYMSKAIDKDLASTEAIALVKRYLSIARHTSNITDSEMSDFINKHSEEIRDTIRVARKGKNTAIAKKAGFEAAVLGAIINGVDLSVLLDFATCINTGFMDDSSQSAAILLRNYMLGIKGGGSTPANDLAAYTEMAIRDFVAGRPRKLMWKEKKHIYITDDATNTTKI